MEDFQHLLNDQRPQVVKSLDGFPHKLQHISGGGLVGVTEELHQLQTRQWLSKTHWPSLVPPRVLVLVVNAADDSPRG